MVDTAKLTDLLARIEAATGPDRDLDRAIGFALDGWELSGDAENLIYVPADVTYYADHPGGMYPSFTESLGAALALVERVNPGWASGFDSGPKTSIAFIDPHDFADRIGGGRYLATAKTVPLAILLALLRSIEGGAECP